MPALTHLAPIRAAALAAVAATAPLAAAAQNDAAPQDPAAAADQIRAQSHEALQQTLLELLALRQVAHQAHWNVIGPEFYQLHEFYEELYTGLDAPIDTLGARLRSLGFPVDARPSSVAGTVTFRDPGEAGAETTLTGVVGPYRQVSASLYDRIEATGDDLPTQDLLIGISRMIDKHLWMIRAHLGGS